MSRAPALALAFGGCSSESSISGSGVSEEVASPERAASPNETVSQQNARESAESYLTTGSFSRESLLSQLKYEGFSNADANYAIDASGANWRDEAVESAQSYLETGSFSRKRLTNQLTYEGFSPGNAAYAVSASGANWKAEAAESAKGYLDSGSFSRQSLTDQLLYEGFTAEQAAYGVNQTGL